MDYSTDRLYHYWQSYGECDLSCGRRRDALEKLRKALVLAEEFGERDLRLTRTLTALGLAELDSRRHEAAIATLQRALEVATTAQADPPTTQRILDGLVEACSKVGRLADAIEYARGAAEIREILFGKASYQASHGKLNLADLLLSRGDAAAAEPLYRQALMALEASADPEVDDVLDALGGLHQIYQRLGRWEDAIRVLERQVQLRRKHRRYGRRMRAASEALAAARVRCGSQGGEAYAKPDSC